MSQNKNTDLTRQQYDELLADDLKAIDHAADGYHQAHVADRAAWELFQSSPHEYTPAEARILYQNLQSSAALVEHFTPQHVDFIKRELSAKHHVDHVVGRTKALSAELDGKCAGRDEARNSLTKLISDTMGKLFAPGMDAAKRNELDYQAEQRKDTLLQIEAAVEHARREIDYFSKHPTLESWNRAVGSIAVIKFPAA